MTPEIKKRIEKIRHGNVPEGYIKVETAIIPSKWREVVLGDVINIFRGASPRPKGDPRYYGGSIPRLLIEDLTRDGKYAIPKIDFLTEEGARKSRLLPKGSLVMSCSGTRVGIIGFLGIDACIHDGFFGFNGYQEIEQEYLYQYFQLFSQNLQSSATQGGVFNNLTTDIMKTMKCCFPPIDEQYKIVEILTTQDKIIEQKEKLLAEKLRQKKYLMQQLLTGKKRLPGFDGEWKRLPFTEVFSFLPTNTLSRDCMSETVGTVLNIHYGDVLVKYPEILDADKIGIPFIKHGFEPSNISYVRNGDVIIADTAEDLSVGKAVEVQNVSQRLIASGLHTMFCRPNHDLFAAGWLGYYINSSVFHDQLLPLISGVKVSSISKKEIIKTTISVPTIEEQRAIANILSVADVEIMLLNQDIEQEKQKKKALMQLLLTGIVRVNI